MECKGWAMETSDLPWDVLRAVRVEHFRCRMLLDEFRGVLNDTHLRSLLSVTDAAHSEWGIAVARVRVEAAPRLTQEDLGEFFKEQYVEQVRAALAYDAPISFASTPRSGKAIAEYHANWVSRGHAGMMCAPDVETDGALLRSWFDDDGASKSQVLDDWMPKQDVPLLSPDPPLATADPDLPLEPPCPNCGRAAAPEHVVARTDSRTYDVRCWNCETQWEHTDGS